MGTILVFLIPSNTTWASRASSNGALSPIGDAFAKFAARVPTFRIPILPYLERILLKSL